MLTPPLNATLEASYLEEVFDGLLAEIVHPGPAGLSARAVLRLRDGADAFVVTLPVPGLGIDDVDVCYADGVLTLRAPHLYRTVYLPAPVDAAHRQTTLREGVLTVELPKGHGAAS